MPTGALGIELDGDPLAMVETEPAYHNGHGWTPCPG